MNSSLRSLGIVAGLALPVHLGCADVPQTIRPDSAGSGGIVTGGGTAGTGASSPGGVAGGGAGGLDGAGGAAGFNAAGSGNQGTGGGPAGSSGLAGTAGAPAAGGAAVGGSSGFGSAGSSNGGGGASGASGGAAASAGTPDITPEAYYAEVCAECHGANGEGAVDGPEVQHPFDDFATWVIRTGRTGHPDYEDDMAEYGPTSLPDPILSGVLEYLANFPQPTTGEALFVDYCANCHGADATGGVTGVDISQEPLAELIEHAREGSHPGEFPNREEFMPAFDESVLSDAEIGLISQYLAAL